MNKKNQEGSPSLTFSVLSAVAVIVGIVIGIGIFRLPPLVAGNASTGIEYILFWVAGGGISLLGALCYAELASANPDAGGEYHFLRKGFGSSIAFLFSWGRMTVIQTGSIALIAFILGDYATLLLNLGAYSSTIYAALTVILLTGLNILGTGYSKSTQNSVTTLIVISLVFVAAAGLLTDANVLASSTLENSSAGGTFGAAMIFVLLTYGGWNEAAYLSGEIKNVRKNMTTVLILGIGIITAVYVVVNYAYLNVLGLETIRNSGTVGAALSEAIFGANGGIIISFIIIIAALSTANATIVTGARTNYALGRDYSVLKYLGRWNKERNAPQNALLVQGGIALVLILLGTYTPDAISAMVDYTAPVFWFFLLLTTSTLFIFRQSNSAEELPYKVPFYPFTPIIFMLVSGYMVYSSVIFTGTGALVGIGIFLLGIPFLVWNEKK